MLIDSVCFACVGKLFQSTAELWPKLLFVSALRADILLSTCSLISVHSFPFTYFRSLISVHFLCSLEANQRLVFKITSLFLNIKFNMADHWGDHCVFNFEKASIANTNISRFFEHRLQLQTLYIKRNITRE